MEKNLTFHDRIQLSNTNADKLIADLQNMGFTTILNGVEHTHPEFNNLLNQSHDTTSLMIRYAPDGIIGIGKPMATAYVEFKTFTANLNIEKDAYLNYMRIYNNGGIVIIIYAHTNYKTKLWNYIQNITFLENKSNFPNDDDGWIAPRLSPNWDTLKYKYHGSGTPYKRINPYYMKHWDLLKCDILNTM